MLRKLIKHELRATSRIMLPLFLLVLVTAAGGNLATKELLETDIAFLNVLGIILLTAFMVAIAAVCIVAFFLMVQRFYKNLLQDEGYVMMTLPVSVHQHIWSKVLVSNIWFAATFLVVLAAVLILAFDIEYVAQFFREFSLFWETAMEYLSQEGIGHLLLFVLELLLLVFTGAVLSCLQFYAPMAIGQSFAKSKLLMSVVVYFAINFIMQLISGIIASIAEKSGVANAFGEYIINATGLAAVHPILLLSIVSSAILAGIFYALTAYNLKNRLNLE